MAHTVRVNTGYQEIVLPDGNSYDGPAEVVLTSDEWDRVSPSAISSGVLTDLGSVPDPNIDEDFVSETEFAEQGPSGRLLDEAESTVAQTGITALVDLTGLTITFNVGTRPVLVTLELPWVTITAAGISAFAVIADAANVTKRICGSSPQLATAPQGVSLSERITVPGTYTRKARLQRYGASGSVGNNADVANVVARLAAVEQ